MTIQPIMTNTDIKIICPFINNDLDEELVNATSVNVQNTLLRDTLGIKYYDSIYTQFLSGGTTGFTVSDQLIFDSYLQYIIAWGVMRDLIIPMMYQLNSDGVRVTTSDHSEAATDNGAEKVRLYWQNLINERRVEMTKHLKNNIKDYPLYWHGQKQNINQFPIHGISRNRRSGGMGLGFLR